MLKTIAAAALVIGLGGGASAAPIAPSALGAQAGDPALIQIAKRDRDRRHWRGDRHRRHWRGHRHWRHGPPRGWHRYHRRPWDWRTRGCVMFGPVWFCP
jgi:hypothetical protein